MKTTDAGVPSNVAENIQPCGIRVDEEGDWYHKANRIIRADILAGFLENLRESADGSFLVEWNETLCSLDVEDTVFVVSRVDRVKGEGAAGEKIVLTLKHLTEQEPLDPTSLRVGRDNVMYCRVRGGRFAARFLRPAYYQLAEMIREDETVGGFCLELNGVCFAIRTVEKD